MTPYAALRHEPRVGAHRSELVLSYDKRARNGERKQRGENLGRGERGVAVDKDDGAIETNDRPARRVRSRYGARSTEFEPIGGGNEAAKFDRENSGLYEQARYGRARDWQR